MSSSNHPPGLRELRLREGRKTVKVGGNSGNGPRHSRADAHVNSEIVAADKQLHRSQPDRASLLRGKQR